MENKELKRMKELIPVLKEAARAYYQEDREIMSNLEYDALYDELAALEESTGVRMAGSPTSQVGYTVLGKLPKEKHESPMLSLDKTKDPERLAAWLGSREGLLSWKMDGLTIVLTYEGGVLEKAVTRGDGITGEVITENARVFENIPLAIPYAGTLVLRGEAVIKYSDFFAINAALPEGEDPYKNPRNLCSSSVRQQNTEIAANRHINFFAFALVSAQGIDFADSRENQLEWLRSQGFETVEYRRVTADAVPAAVKQFEAAIEKNDFPSDGLVLIFDDIEYGRSLGRTAKFPRDSIAFKWEDETADATLLYVEWSASRTGLINPVAVFTPVELEGTTVKRAGVHNVSIVRELMLGEGDVLSVYKANMIIPQIAENRTRSNTLLIPEVCPVCGKPTAIHDSAGVKSLYCMNAECPAKKIKRFAHFVSRDALNVEGLSEQTLEKLIDAGFIREFADLFALDKYKDKILMMDGFAEKSYENLMAAIETARHTDAVRFIYSLGIDNVGLVGARMLCAAFGNDIARLRAASAEELLEIDGVGPVIAESVTGYFADGKNSQEADRLLEILDISAPAASAGEVRQVFAGKVFVITGAVHSFANRSEAKAFIESRGGKVTGSVSGNTDYLVNNDSTSSSSKNRRAMQLGIPVITEEELIDMTGQE